MSLDFKDNLKATVHEGLITITNISPEPLINIKLILENLNINISEYKVVRERGSLTFPSSLKFIELGNLFPDESAELYLKPVPDEPTIKLTEPLLQDIQISYTLDTEESVTSNLSELTAIKP